jgi:hypothetical protein
MLFETFGAFGQVVDAVVMERNGHPRGFGFVTFKEKSSIDDVLAVGVCIDGREVDLKRAVPEEDMVFCPSKVFVGGLPQSVDKAALKLHFEAFGEVKDAVVMMDRATSRSRGFGFVRFATSEGVEAALATPHLLDGQWIDVKRAQPADALPTPKYPRTRAEIEADEAEEVRSSSRGRNVKAAPFEPAAQPAFAPEPQVNAELQAYMAGMAQTWWTMSQGFQMGGLGVPSMGMPGFCPPYYPTPAYPVAQPANDITNLLASMGIQGADVPAAKEAKEVPKSKVEPKKEAKEAKARAEFGALEFKLPLQSQAAFAPFSDVSNVLETNPSPNKSVSPVRRANPIIDQENPQVA